MATLSVSTADEASAAAAPPSPSNQPRPQGPELGWGHTFRRSFTTGSFKSTFRQLEHGWLLAIVLAGKR